MLVSKDGKIKVEMHYTKYSPAQHHFRAKVLQGTIEDEDLITAADNMSFDDKTVRHYGGCVSTRSDETKDIIVYID
jgi:hypothetical protein